MWMTITPAIRSGSSPNLPPGPVTITVTTADETFTLPADPDVFAIWDSSGIPTLSQWGMLLLLAALIGAGLYVMNRSHGARA
ncbi:MAG: IPTL-CTERM sorting domain-containing protein [Acidobacteria bacterium]|nr:MAG: IPTL-CTERM sorting domain-containing protein [Acidobacteriota bacterium]